MYSSPTPVPPSPPPPQPSISSFPLTLASPQVGGQVSLHGMPVSAQTPSWVRLTRPAVPNATYIDVDADVANWPVNAPIAIASTSIDLNEAEVTYVREGE